MPASPLTRNKPVAHKEVTEHGSPMLSITHSCAHCRLLSTACQVMCRSCLVHTPQGKVRLRGWQRCAAGTHNRTQEEA
jgi:hypothetical protein